MAAVNFYLPYRLAVKPTNVGAPGSQLCMYAPGTTTKRPMYTTNALTTQHPNPLIADGAGRWPAVYLDNSLTYKYVVKDSAGAVLDQMDPYIPGQAPDASELQPYADAAADSALAAAASEASAAASALAAEAVFTGTAGVVALPRITPEMYAAQKPSGVIGDGTDDGPALSAACAALNALGGGALDFYSGRTYFVGGQTLNKLTSNGTYRYGPNTEYPLKITGCTKPVTIYANGAKIKCLSGAKFGSFTAGGGVYSPSLPFSDATYAATPYFAMVYIQGNSGPVTIVGVLELDGNIAGATIGGQFGDTGWQLSCHGYIIRDNTGPVDLEFYSHHHGCDGGQFDGPGLLTTRENAKLGGKVHNNGRNGLSVIGGNGLVIKPGFQTYSNGKSANGVSSNPSAGIDFESEGSKYVCNIVVNQPEIYDNAGAGFIADQATNTFAIDVYGGRIVGTTNYSVWPHRPKMRFHGTQIMGCMVALYGSATNPNDAVEFNGCYFLWAPTQSPTGTLYSTGVAKFHDPGSSGTNTRCNECIFEWNAAADGVGSQTSITWFHDCSIVTNQSTYIGLYGNVSGVKTSFNNSQSVPRADLAITLALNYTGQSFDSFLYNGTRYEADTDRATGKKLYYGSATYDPPSLSAAAKTTIQTMTVTGVALGDKVEDVSFSVNLAGARIAAWVSTTDTVSFYVINENGANPLDLASGTVRVKVRQA